MVTIPEHQLLLHTETWNKELAVHANSFRFSFILFSLSIFFLLRKKFICMFYLHVYLYSLRSAIDYYVFLCLSIFYGLYKGLVLNFHISTFLFHFVLNNLH